MTGPLPDVRRRCRVCLQPVPVHRPTGTRVERADRHRPTGVGPDADICKGSYGPTDDLTFAAREDAGTRRWAASHTRTIEGYLQEKGEIR